MGILRVTLRRGFMLSVGGFFLAQAAAAETGFRTLEDGFGPLQVRSQSPVQVLRLTPFPRAPIIPSPGKKEFRAMTNVSNIWAQGADYFLDLQLADLRFAVLLGLEDNWAVEMAVNERRVFNAHLDGFVIGFHDAFGIPQHGRDKVPRNDTRVSFPEQGIELDDDSIGIFSRAVEATLVKKLWNQRGIRPALAVSFTVRYETRNAPLHPRPVDYGVEINLGKRLGRAFVYSNLSYTRFGSDRFLSLPLRHDQFTGMFAYEWRTDAHEALILQYLCGEGVAVGLGELSQTSHEIILGYKWLRGNAVWELSLTENIINFENTPDFGVTGAVSYRF